MILAHTAEAVTSRTIIPDIEEEARFECDSRSSVSTSNSLSSERARLAGLKAKAACLKQKHELEQQAQKIQAMRETLEVEMLIKEASAREEVLRAEEENKELFKDGSGSETPITSQSIGAMRLNPPQSDIGYEINPTRSISRTRGRSPSTPRPYNNRLDEVFY